MRFFQTFKNYWSQFLSIFMLVCPEHISTSEDTLLNSAAYFLFWSKMFWFIFYEDVFPVYPTWQIFYCHDHHKMKWGAKFVEIYAEHKPIYIIYSFYFIGYGNSKCNLTSMHNCPCLNWKPNLATNSGLGDALKPKVGTVGNKGKSQISFNFHPVQIFRLSQDSRICIL